MKLFLSLLFIFSFACSSDDNNTSPKTDIGKTDTKTEPDMGKDSADDADTCCTDEMCEVSGKFCNPDSCSCEEPDGCTAAGEACVAGKRDADGLACIESTCLETCDFFDAGACPNGKGCQLVEKTELRKSGNILGFCKDENLGTASIGDACDGTSTSTTCEDVSFCWGGTCRQRCDAFSKSGGSGMCAQATEECFITEGQAWGTCRVFCSPWNDTDQCQAEEICFPDGRIGGVGECKAHPAGPVLESAACDDAAEATRCLAEFSCVDNICREVCDRGQNGGGGLGDCRAPRSCRVITDGNNDREYGYCG